MGLKYFKGFQRLTLQRDNFPILLRSNLTMQFLLYRLETCNLSDLVCIQFGRQKMTSLVIGSVRLETCSCLKLQQTSIMKEM